MTRANGRASSRAFMLRFRTSYGIMHSTVCHTDIRENDSVPTVESRIRAMHEEIEELVGKFETKKSPLPGGHIDVRVVRLASRPAPPCCAPAPVPPSCIAITVHAAAPPFTTVQERCLTSTVGVAQARFIRMKSASKNRAPTIVNLTVKRGA